jgi:hypothetical protein
MPVSQPSGVPYFGSLLLLSWMIVCKSSYHDSLKYLQNRLSQKLSKLRVALVGAKADISDKVMVQKLLDCLGKLKGNSVCGRLEYA